MDKQRYWFPAKRFGWGWGPPCTWQGWVVFVVWLVVLAGGMAIIGWRTHPLGQGLFIVVMVLILLLVCWWKGEPPGWRWG